MWNWVRENAAPATCAVCLVGFAFMAIISFHEWLIDSPKYMRDAAQAAFYLGLGLVQLQRWRRQLRM